MIGSRIMWFEYRYFGYRPQYQPETPLSAREIIGVIGTTVVRIASVYFISEPIFKLFVALFRTHELQKDGMVIFFLGCFRKVKFRKMQLLKHGVQTVVMHQSFESPPPPPTPRDRGIAGLLTFQILKPW